MTVAARCFVHPLQLAQRRPTELDTPHDRREIEKPSLLEIIEWSASWLVGDGAVLGQLAVNSGRSAQVACASIPKRTACSTMRQARRQLLA